MRPSSNARRPRGRPHRRQGGGGVPNKNHNFDSNGPEGRVRGNAHQVYEKYVTLARDAQSAGDRILSESFLQHAEHYFRIVNDSMDPQDENRRRVNGHDGSTSQGSGEEREADASSEEFAGDGERQPEEQPARRRGRRPGNREAQQGDSQQGDSQQGDSQQGGAGDDAGSTGEPASAEPDQQPQPKRRGRPRKLREEDLQTKSPTETADS